MTRLEELRQKRKEIDAEIKKIQNCDYRQHGNAKIDSEHYTTGREKEYKVCVIYKPVGGVARWSTVIRSTNRQEAIDRIPEIIRDLRGLYDDLMKEKE